MTQPTPQSKEVLMKMLKDNRFPLAEVMSALKAIDEQAIESVENETSMSDGEKRRIIYALIEEHEKDRQSMETVPIQDEQI